MKSSATVEMSVRAGAARIYQRGPSAISLSDDNFPSIKRQTNQLVVLSSLKGRRYEMVILKIILIFI
jgi:hypothetical protein